MHLPLKENQQKAGFTSKHIIANREDTDVCTKWNSEKENTLTHDETHDRVDVNCLLI